MVQIIKDQIYYSQSLILSKWGATEDFQQDRGVKFVFEKEQLEECGGQEGQ